MASLLIIDDEKHVRYSFRKIFEGDKGRVLAAATGAEGMRLFEEQRPDAVFLDLQLPDCRGLEVFKRIQEVDPKRPVVIITAHGTTDTAIEAMKAGAFDYLLKPLDLERLSQVIDRALEASRLMTAPAMLPLEDERADRIVGHSPVIQEMCKVIGRTAPQDVNVLILGESGAGKELVARALYQHSQRAERPFLAINCAAIPEALLESELFGHERGAFTGADRRRIGKFEQCSGGTLFFDEIGDMAPGLQAKMLRVLQEQRFERVGSNETVQTQVRVLAATNQELDRLVDEGRFRKDLYYRLKVVTVQVPPLRERREDVAELAHYFLYRFNRELGLDFRAFAPETIEALERHDWPGNVRELQGVIKQAMLRGAGPVLLPDLLPVAATRARPAPEAPATGGGAADLDGLIEALVQAESPELYRQVTEAVDRVLFTRVLRQTRGRLARAAELLGLHRATLRHKLRSLGISTSKVVIDEAEPPPDEPTT
ncbi:MAG: sigma-54-dependent Fis family transcriptional regulator [Planctomycetia bacterium]|nr:sigma-54-dependent Fis family transcriptional regulator [Planctomycetia bacterium]